MSRVGRRDRSNRTDIRVLRIREHVEALEDCDDFDFCQFIERILELNLRELEYLFERQLRFFDLASHRQGRNEESIASLIHKTQDLQLEMCDLSLLHQRMLSKLASKGFNAASTALRRR